MMKDGRAADRVGAAAKRWIIVVRGFALLLLLVENAWSVDDRKVDKPTVTLRTTAGGKRLDATASLQQIPQARVVPPAIDSDELRKSGDWSAAIDQAIVVSSTEVTFIEYKSASVSAVVYNLRESGKPGASGRKDMSLTSCTSLAAGDSELILAPRALRCVDGRIHDKALLVVLTLDDEYRLILRVPNGILPIAGTEFGFALNLRDRESDGEKFLTNGEIAGYISLSTLKSRHWRGVGHIALLDDDAETDIEVGLGAGVAFRAGGWGPNDVAGFSFSVGVAWNMMLDHDGRYTFVGLGINLEPGKEPAPSN